MEYDLIVIGAGPVGENVADRAKAGGLSVVIVEAELIGGECSFWACVPSKALLRPAAALAAARAVAGADAAITGTLDAAAVLRRRDDAVGDWDDASGAHWLEQTGIDLVRGHGRITGVRTVTVTPTDPALAPIQLRARHAVAVCTGSDAAVPDIPGLRAAAPWTSREATSAEEVPAHLAVIGGGTVGCEMATVFRSLGGAVTMIARRGLLGGMEPFAGEAVQASLTASGVEVLTGTTPTAVHRGPDGRVRIEFDGRPALEADEVLVATGRSPRTGELGLETVGLEPGGWITVDDTLRVPGSDWLYAVGDVNHRALLTHQGKYQARAAGDVIAARANGTAVDDAAWGVHAATADHAAVPQVTFTDPEVASVGLTAAAAARLSEQEGRGIRVIDYQLGWVSGASLHRDGYRGQVRAVIDTDREVLLGLTFVGPDVAELLHAATIAVVAEVPLNRLWHAVPAFPTLSEVWLRLLEEYGRPEAA
ncbi:pyridine nucleotide-disulfide oxidoreductase [Microterricola viridarii]|uniref:Pyridine nucleotide-disulfide oxidoreductase n=1 Tax=Microterricola viridarii TaxID=412690 RepID=A0A109QYB4_9MICO|nr:pyridine nucleotide-disulfide oxidoreductase [Microterricola viridarii]